MGAFDLPSGEFDLLLKDRTGEHWESVMFTDSIDNAVIADCVEMWSENHTVLAARFNGRAVTIPTKYHWELRSKDEVFGKFATREEAKKAMYERKAMWRKDKVTRPGIPVFVKD